MRCLQGLFVQFQFSDYDTLQPDPVRVAMAETFAVEDRFQLNMMDDAAECFVSDTFFTYIKASGRLGNPNSVIIILCMVILCNLLLRDLQFSL